MNWKAKLFTLGVLVSSGLFGWFFSSTAARLLISQNPSELLLMVGMGATLVICFIVGYILGTLGMLFCDKMNWLDF